MTSGEVQVNMSKFTWKLKDFSKLHKNVGEKILSPRFKMNDSNDLQWQLQLYPFGDIRESSKNHLSLYLISTSCTKVTPKISFKITLLDVNEIEIISNKTTYQFKVNGDGFGWSTFIHRDVLLENINKPPNDELNVTCIIYLDKYNAKEIDINKKILNNYESLFYNEDFSDLTIIIKKKEMKVHKNILSARSPVIKAMLSHNMKENNTSTIKITDISHNIMKEFLLFIYSGKVTDINKDAKDLLPVAEKYQIDELKVLCEKSILKNIKIQDACEILSMAALYNCSELKAKVIEFIIANIKEIKETAGFKTLIRSQPVLFEEIFNKIVEKNG